MNPTRDVYRDQASQARRRLQPSPLCPICDGPTKFMAVVKGRERFYCLGCEVEFAAPAGGGEGRR